MDAIALNGIVGDAQNDNNRIIMVFKCLCMCIWSSCNAAVCNKHTIHTVQQPKEKEEEEKQPNEIGKIRYKWTFCIRFDHLLSCVCVYV